MPKAKDLVFYREWFPLPKGKFRILAMLADKGQFNGNLSDLCRYFFVNPQTATRNRLANQINSLEEQGYIKVKRKGRTYTLTAIPKARIIKIAREHYELIRTRTRAPDGESVAWENVLKTALRLKCLTEILKNLPLDSILSAGLRFSPTASTPLPLRSSLATFTRALPSRPAAADSPLAAK